MLIYKIGKDISLSSNFQFSNAYSHKSLMNLFVKEANWYHIKFFVVVTVKALSFLLLVCDVFYDLLVFILSFKVTLK